MKIQYLQVLVMPNGEILCEGKTVGFTSTLGKYLKDEVTPETVHQHFEELKTTIREYESDTFSSSGWEITEQEVTALATQITIKDLQARANCLTLDGVELAERLEGYRDRD